ncbi:MAG: hypothetical protein JWM00_554, partial [Candidatus Saccharibacteria bacterium]|nr:hypothetical protein [Candidatus Saccharibacteria bacterium]
TGAGTTYCVTASVATVSYKIDSSTASTTPVQGVCSGHTADGYIVNLHPNPGALSTGGYSNYAGLSPNASSLSTVAAGWASSGSASRATWSVGGDPTQGDLGIYTNSNSALTSGRTYTLRYRINAGQNATVAGPGIWANSGIFSITASSAGTTSFIANTPVTRWVTFTGDAAALGSGLRIVQHPTIAAGYYYEISDVTLYEGVYNSAINFCWGNSPGWIWNGTANNSTSTGPPL